MERDDHQQIGQLPRQRTFALDTRERRLQPREPIADELTTADLARTVRLEDLTARARAAIARADQRMEASAERLDRSATIMGTCLERLRWTSAMLGSDLTLPYSWEQLRTTADGTPRASKAAEPSGRPSVVQGGGRRSSAHPARSSAATSVTDRSSA